MTNWKTTLLGLAAGALNLLANGVNYKQVLLSVGLAGIGLVSKDFNMSNAPTPLPQAQAVTGPAVAGK